VNVGGPEGSGRQPHSVEEPLGTVLTENHTAVVEPFLMAVNHTSSSGKDTRCYPTDEPLGTLTTKASFAVVDATAEKVDDSFIVKYYGTGATTSVDEPLDTVTTKDRFGLVTINGEKYRLDIRLRMLEPKELAAAHSMGGYKFHGGRSMQVKQIGNGVPAGLSEALTGHILNQYSQVQEENDVPIELLASQAEASHVHA
jgi:DNA (cytosine-5)-methyltransferase 1